MRLTKILFGIAALLGTAVLTSSTLTYSGLCISQMRYVSDEEKIRAVVSQLLGRSDVKHFELTDSGLVEVPGPTPIVYRSIEEFFEINKGCCSIGPRGGDGYIEPTFRRRITGIIADIVVVDYLDRYIDEHGAKQSRLLTGQVAVDVCGRVVTQVPF